MRGAQQTASRESRNNIALHAFVRQGVFPFWAPRSKPRDMVKAALLPSRSGVRISGLDAASFLQGLLTQDVPGPGEARFAALLTPQGKILFDFFIIENDGAFFLDVAGDAADALVRRLSMYRLRAKVAVERLEDWAAASIFEDDGAPVASAGLIYADPRLAGLGRRVLGSREALASLALEGDENGYNARRIALGVPEFGKDFAADEVFLLDVNYDVLRGVSYKKGCFVGQEVTSRMKRKGEIRKRSLLLSFNGPPPEKGAEVTAGETALGEVMSGVDGKALAIIRLDRLESSREKSAEIESGGRPARIVFPAYLEQSKT